MSMRTLKILSILLPPVLIGGFEYFRHDFLLHELSMETGNLYITLLTLLMSFLFTTWMFDRIRTMNERLSKEQAKRAVYEERERLAQELHDNIAQILFFLNVQLKKGQIQEARSAAAEIDLHLRQAIFNLRTPPEEGGNFAARLRAWLKEWSALSGIAVESRISESAETLPPPAEVPLFSIIREAFTNIRKHSLADQATIELGRMGDEGGWRLYICDNGAGMSGGAVPEAGGRYGLSMIRKRAEELGATLEIQSSPENGLELTVTGTTKKGATDENKSARS
ncbi:ATP-binding protein [Paenibacillus solanacearum]|uniref:sensor histidine kinase n=1 Tax=Paenibacillus solanacearum TaxID=2048548 RepID=UPI001C403100